MALIQCPDCNAEISSEAPACPRCGRPIKPHKVIAVAPPKPKEVGCLSGCLIVGVVFVIIPYIVMLFTGGPKSSTSDEGGPVIPVRHSPAPSPEAMELSNLTPELAEKAYGKPDRIERVGKSVGFRYRAQDLELDFGGRALDGKVVFLHGEEHSTHRTLSADEILQRLRPRKELLMAGKTPIPAPSPTPSIWEGSKKATLSALKKQHGPPDESFELEGAVVLVYKKLGVKLWYSQSTDGIYALDGAQDPVTNKNLSKDEIERRLNPKAAKK